MNEQELVQAVERLQSNGQIHKDRLDAQNDRIVAIETEMNKQTVSRAKAKQ